MSGPCLFISAPETRLALLFFVSLCLPRLDVLYCSVCLPCPCLYLAFASRPPLAPPPHCHALEVAAASWAAVEGRREARTGEEVNGSGVAAGGGGLGQDKAWPWLPRLGLARAGQGRQGCAGLRGGRGGGGRQAHFFGETRWCPRCLPSRYPLLSQPRLPCSAPLSAAPLFCSSLCCSLKNQKQKTQPCLAH